MKATGRISVYVVCLILEILVICSGCKRSSEQHAEQNSHAPHTTVIAAVGDSITWGALAYGQKAPSGGYPAVLETRFRNAGYEVVIFNKGIPGEKAYQTRDRFRYALADADIALLMIGTNDIIRPEECPEPHNCRTAKHIEAMIVQALEADITLLLGTAIPAAPPPCARSWANTPIQALNAEIAALAQKHQIALVDNHQALLEYGGEIFSDCLHLTDGGYAILAENWYHALIESQILEKTQPD